MVPEKGQIGGGKGQNAPDERKKGEIRFLKKGFVVTGRKKVCDRSRNRAFFVSVQTEFSLL